MHRKLYKSLYNNKGYGLGRLKKKGKEIKDGARRG
jgi:hypothetical protein